MQRREFLKLSLPACLAAGGCGNPKSTAKFRIAVIPKGTTHDFWRSIHAGALHAGRERGNVDILWEGPAKEDQRHEQQQIVERFTSEGVHAIILAPCDRTTLVLPVEGAVKKNIAVAIIDSGLVLSDAIAKSPKYLGYVATDNLRGGMEAARRMVALLEGKSKAKVMLIRYQKGSESTEQRETGFRAGIAEAGDRIELIEAADEAGATVDSAQKVAERLLSDHKDLDGIFAPNESSTLGLLRAREVLGRLELLKQVGFDGSEVLIQALRAGKLHGLVLQDPFDMGYRGVLRAVDHLEGKPAPANPIHHTNLQVATKENLDTPAIKPLYARDLSAYLGK